MITKKKRQVKNRISSEKTAHTASGNIKIWNKNCRKRILRASEARKEDQTMVDTRKEKDLSRTFLLRSDNILSFESADSNKRCGRLFKFQIFGLIIFSTSALRILCRNVYNRHLTGKGFVEGNDGFRTLQAQRL